MESLNEQRYSSFSPPGSLFEKRIILAAALAILFILALAIRLDDLNDLPLDFHPTRQLWSALLARGMYYESLPSLPTWMRQPALAQYKSEEVLEPRIMETLAVIGYRLTGGENLWIPRFLSILFWLLGGIPLFLLARSLTSEEGAFVALSFYLILPYAIESSRIFQPDPLMVALLIAACWAFYRWYEVPTWKNAVLAGVLAALAIFSKVVAVFPLMGGMAGLLLAGRGVKKTLRDPQVWATGFLALFPTVAYLLYGYLISGELARRSGGRFFPDLLVSPFFYLRWENKIGFIMGHALLVLALIGVLLYTRRTKRFFILGLWLGYIVYGLAFNHHISTHDYYSMPLIPIAALSLAPVGDMLLKRLAAVAGPGAGRSLFSAAVVGLMLMGMILVDWDVHKSFKQVDYRSLAYAYQAVGEAVKHKNTVVALTEDYGYRLAYWGFLNTNVWPSYGDLNYMKQISGKTPDFSQLFKTYTAGKEYFVVTWTAELDLQPDLRTKLYDHYPIFTEGQGYVIFDLKHPLAAHN
ncbi:MAG: ArnT family glycosyltransferase [Omnitrophica WOR_2 bacterium]